MFSLIHQRLLTFFIQEELPIPPRIMDTIRVAEEPTSVKRERSTSPVPVEENRDIKRQAQPSSAVVRAPPEFPWRTCQKLSAVERLKIKEKAVAQAQVDCEKIRNVLEMALYRLSKDPDTKDAVMMGQNIIMEWLKEYGKLKHPPWHSFGSF
jgi:hypothetical protein